MIYLAQWGQNFTIFWSGRKKPIDPKTMANTVKISIPEIKLGRTTVVTIEVKSKDGILGVLSVFQGKLEWLPRGKQIPCKIGWKEFDKFATGLRTVKRKKAAKRARNKKQA